MQTLITVNNPEANRYNVDFRDLTLGELMALNAMLKSAKTCVQYDVSNSFANATKVCKSLPKYFFD